MLKIADQVKRSRCDAQAALTAAQAVMKGQENANDNSETSSLPQVPFPIHAIR